MTRINPDSIIATKRTAAPLVWAFVVGLLAEWGLDVDALIGDRDMTRTALLFLLALALWGVAQLLGKRWPWIERLILGSAARPHYDGEPAAPETRDEAPGAAQ